MCKLKLGRIVATNSIVKRMNEDKNFQKFVWDSFSRYVSFDWGELSENDKQLNDSAVREEDSRICAAYICPRTKDKIWIVTEADRSATTILFPYEY